METDKILGTNYTIGQLQLIHKYIKEAYKTEDESSDGKVDINAYIDDILDKEIVFQRQRA